jgi:lysophospholipase L1-like esterase
MKIAFAALAGLAAVIGAPGAAHAAAPFYLHDGDRVVMYGDSITDQRLYTLYTEEFVTTRFPKLKIDWINAGWSGDRVVGGGGGTADVRVQRDVLAYKPTVVTIMLGMNDGFYKAFDQRAYDMYTTGYGHIVDTIKAGDPGVRFTFIQPSPYDDVTRPVTFDGGYNSVLLRFSDYIKDLGAKEKQTVTDFNTPMVAMLTKAKTTDTALAQRIIPDRVHPGPGGHFVMAEALLKTWNAPGVVSAVTIDAGKKSVEHSENTTVAKLAVTDTIAWDQTDNALPMPLDLRDPTTALAVNSSDFVSALNQQTLTVSSAPAAKYELKIDDKSVGSFTKEQLAAGVNLATLTTPMATQALRVAGLAKSHSDIQNRRWRSVQVPMADEKDADLRKPTNDLITALNTREASIVASMRAMAQPTPHHFTLTPAP